MHPQTRCPRRLKWRPSGGSTNILSRGAGWTGVNVQNLLTNRDDAGTPLDLSDDVLARIDPDSVDNPRRVFQRGRYPEATTEHWGARLSATYDAGPVQFELLGSYRFQDWLLFSGSNAGIFTDPANLLDQGTTGPSRRSSITTRNRGSASSGSRLPMISGWCGASGCLASMKTRARSSARSRPTRAGSTSSTCRRPSAGQRRRTAT